MKYKNLYFNFATTLAALIFYSLENLEAVTSKEVFAKYSNKYFIESGTYIGDGVKMALEASFEEIYSIELSPHLYEMCKEMFDATPNVHLFFGDSTKVMPEILKQIDTPATFWLDGHYSWGNTARGDTNSPILQELEIIRNHPIKNHTILIDDIRQCGTVDFDFIELDEIIYKILEINPDYIISYENGHIPNDVLVAKIENKS